VAWQRISKHTARATILFVHNAFRQAIEFIFVFSNYKVDKNHSANNLTKILHNLVHCFGTLLTMVAHVIKVKKLMLF